MYTRVIDVSDEALREYLEISLRIFYIYGCYGKK